jgi:hypothetical protein
MKITDEDARKLFQNLIKAQREIRELERQIEGIKNLLFVYEIQQERETR